MDFYSVLLGLSRDVQKLNAAILFHLINNLLFMYFWCLHTYIFFRLLYSMANSLFLVLENMHFRQGSATRKKAQKGKVKTIAS